MWPLAAIHPSAIFGSRIPDFPQASSASQLCWAGRLLSSAIPPLTVPRGMPAGVGASNRASSARLPTMLHSVPGNFGRHGAGPLGLGGIGAVRGLGIAEWAKKSFTRFRMRVVTPFGLGRPRRVAHGFGWWWAGGGTGGQYVGASVGLHGRGPPQVQSSFRRCYNGPLHLAPHSLPLRRPLPVRAVPDGCEGGPRCRGRGGSADLLAPSTLIQWGSPPVSGAPCPPCWGTRETPKKEGGDHSIKWKSNWISMIAPGQ